MSRLHIDVGQAHDVTPRALVGAITGESGIPGRSVGDIAIQNNFSICLLYTSRHRHDDE